MILQPGEYVEVFCERFRPPVAMELHGDRLTCFGAEFPFTADPLNRQTALRAARAYADALAVDLRQRAGRDLTDAERAAGAVLH